MTLRLFAAGAATIFFFSGCVQASHVGDGSHVERNIAGVIDDVAAPDAFKAHLDSYLEHFYATQKSLNEFDQMLEEEIKNPTGKDLMATDAYARLAAARVLNDQATHAIADAFVAMAVKERDNQFNNSNDRAYSALRVGLEQTGADRIAFQNVYQSILMAAAENDLSNDPRGMSRTSDLVQLASRKLLSNTTEALKLFEESKAEISQNTKEITGDEKSSREIEALANQLKSTMQNTREPQAASGISTGSSYPANQWSLTFDDGPHGKFSLQHVSNLNRYGYKATFFWLAKNVAAMPSVVSAVKAAGMDLANHSYTHANLPKLSSASLRREIIESSDVEARYYGKAPRYFRCPYGACGKSGSQILQLIGSRGMRAVNWNVDSLDWQDHNPASISRRVANQMSRLKSGIILFHDIHPQTVPAAAAVMDQLAKSKKRVVPVSQGLR